MKTYIKGFRLLALAAFCVYSSQALAYLDPGTGSLILQGLIAAVAGSLFTIKLYWRNIRHFISRLFRTENENSKTVENDSIEDTAKISNDQ